LREQSPQAIFETGELELVDEHFLLFLFCQESPSLESFRSPDHFPAITRVVSGGVRPQAELDSLDRR
jgi:hypothetical protein